jgi:hypothetical protein
VAAVPVSTAVNPASNAEEAKNQAEAAMRELKAAAENISELYSHGATVAQLIAPMDRFKVAREKAEQATANNVEVHQEIEKSSMAAALHASADVRIIESRIAGGDFKIIERLQSATGKYIDMDIKSKSSQENLLAAERLRGAFSETVMVVSQHAFKSATREFVDANPASYVAARDQFNKAREAFEADLIRSGPYIRMEEDIDITARYLRGAEEAVAKAPGPLEPDPRGERQQAQRQLEFTREDYQKAINPDTLTAALHPTAEELRGEVEWALNNSLGTIDMVLREKNPQIETAGEAFESALRDYYRSDRSDPKLRETAQFSALRLRDECQRALDKAKLTASSDPRTINSGPTEDLLFAFRQMLDSADENVHKVMSP